MKIFYLLILVFLSGCGSLEYVTPESFPPHHSMFGYGGGKGPFLPTLDTFQAGAKLNNFGR